MKRVLLFLLVPALVAAFALTGDTTYSGPPANYLALGDSLGVGVGASDPPTTGYVPLFRNFLESERGLDAKVSLNNLSISGATSGSLISDQLPTALAELARNSDRNPNNDVEVVTVDIGGNDVFALVGVCAGGFTAACITAVTGTFASFSANFDFILDELRTAAGPDTTIIVMTYFNSLVNPLCPINFLESLGNIVLEGGGPLPAGLNDLIRAIAADPAHDAEVSDLVPGGAFPALLGPSHVQPDCLHANDDGYEIIADEFKDAFKDQ